MNYWEYVVKTIELMSNEELDNLIYSSNKKKKINSTLNTEKMLSNRVWNTLYCSRNIVGFYEIL